MRMNDNGASPAASDRPSDAANTEPVESVADASAMRHHVFEVGADERTHGEAFFFAVLAANPGRVRRFCHWRWITDVLPTLASPLRPDCVLHAEPAVQLPTVPDLTPSSS
jgi:hypothetical protein